MDVVPPISQLMARPLPPTTTALHLLIAEQIKQSRLFNDSSNRHHQVSQTGFIHPPRRQPLTPKESQNDAKLVQDID
jgi:hypothetical protein